MSDMWLIVSERMADSSGLTGGRRVRIDSTKFRPWLALRITGFSSARIWAVWSDFGLA